MVGCTPATSVFSTTQGDSSYAIDAVDWHSLRARRGRPLYDAPEPFLGALRDAGCRGSASLGLGEDLRLEGEGVEGSALDADGIVHLTASVIDTPSPA